MWYAEHIGLHAAEDNLTNKIGNLTRICISA